MTSIVTDPTTPHPCSTEEEHITNNVNVTSLRESGHHEAIDRTQGKNDFDSVTSNTEFSVSRTSVNTDGCKSLPTPSESILIDTVASLKDKIAELYADLEALKCAHSQSVEHEIDLKEMVESLRRSRDWYEQQLSVAYSVRSQMDTETERLHALLKERSDTNHKLVHENACLQAELACSQASLADAKRNLSHQLEAIRVDMIEREALFQRIARERANLEELSLKRSEDLNSLQADISTLKTDLKASDAQIERYQTQLQQLKQCLAETEARCSSNEELLRSKEMEIAQKMRDMNENVEHLTAASARIASLEAVLSEKESRILSLMEENNSISAALSAAHKEKNTLDSYILTLKEKLSQIEERFETVQMESHAKNAQMNSLMEERDHLLSQLDVYNQQTPDWNAIVANLQTEKDALLSKLRKLELKDDQNKFNLVDVNECRWTATSKLDAVVQTGGSKTTKISVTTMDRAVGGDIPIHLVYDNLSGQKPDLLSEHVLPNLSSNESLGSSLQPASHSNLQSSSYFDPLGVTGVYAPQDYSRPPFNAPRSAAGNVVVSDIDPSKTDSQFFNVGVSNQAATAATFGIFVPESGDIHYPTSFRTSHATSGVATHLGNQAIEEDSTRMGQPALSDYFSNSSEPFLEPSTPLEPSDVKNIFHYVIDNSTNFEKHEADIPSQDYHDWAFIPTHQDSELIEEYPYPKSAKQPMMQVVAEVQCDILSHIQHENEELKRHLFSLNQSLLAVEADLVSTRSELAQKQALVDHERRSQETAAQNHQQAVDELNSVREMLSKLQVDFENLRQEKQRLQLEAYNVQDKHVARSSAHSDELQALKAIIKTTTTHLANTKESLNRAHSEKLQYQAELARLRGGVRAQLERFRLFTRADASDTVRATISNSTGPLADIFTTLGIDMNGLEELLGEGIDFSLSHSKPIERLEKCFETLQTEVNYLEDQVVNHALALHDTFETFPSTSELIIVPNDEQTTV